MISRRQFLKSCAVACCCGPIASRTAARSVAHPYLANPRRGPCRPVISGPLWWLDPAQNLEWGVSGWRDELDQQSRIGFSLLWLVGVQHSLADEKHTAALQDLMNLCARRKVRVILDVGSSGRWYSECDIAKELTLCSKNIARLGNLFKGHPAFFAWYIPHEIYMTWPDEPMHAYIHKLYPALVNLCKRTVDLPVTVSPFFILDRDQVFGSLRYNEPEEYERYWARLIKLSGVDVVMLQDSGEHFSYVTNEMRRPFFEAMYRACRLSGAVLWGNVETAEYDCPSKEEYIRRYGRIHHSAAKGLDWRPVPIDRLKQKLALAAEFSQEIVTWGYREFCRPNLGKAASNWYQNYKCYLRSIR